MEIPFFSTQPPAHLPARKTSLSFSHSCTPVFATVPPRAVPPARPPGRPTLSPPSARHPSSPHDRLPGPSVLYRTARKTPRNLSSLTSWKFWTLYNGKIFVELDEWQDARLGISGTCEGVRINIEVWEDGFDNCWNE